MTHETPVGSCGRAGLLLSLLADDALTPSQRAELDAHLPGCAACRRAAAADAAVAQRLVERADAPEPAWLSGFAERTVRLALAEAREARSQNRLLWMSAAAALLVAVATQFYVPHPAASDAGSNETASLREQTWLALVRAHRLNEGK